MIILPNRAIPLLRNCPAGCQLQLDLFMQFAATGGCGCAAARDEVEPGAHGYEPRDHVVDWQCAVATIVAL